jgi:tetratricopeptide (TPR) repeat protein
VSSRGRQRHGACGYIAYLVLVLILTSIFSYASFCQEARRHRADTSSDSVLETGIVLARKGNFKEAEKAFEQAVILHPRDARALTALGQVQDELGKLPESIETFRKVIELDPLSANAHVNLGIALGDHGDLAGALMESMNATRLAPNSAGAHFLCGRLLSDLGRRDEARGEFRRVLDLSPGYAEALNYWAALEGDEGNATAQENLLKRYLKLRPDQATAWVQLGHILKDENRESEAIAAWRRALTLNPQYIEPMYLLARALKVADPVQSKQLMQRIQALERDQRTIDRVNLLGNRANGKMNEADYRGSIEDLKNALVLCGRCELLGALEKNLGLAYCHSGQLDAGERELKTAEELDPDDSSVKEALAILKQQRDIAVGHSH